MSIATAAYAIEYAAKGAIDLSDSVLDDVLEDEDGEMEERLRSLASHAVREGW